MVLWCMFWHRFPESINNNIKWQKNSSWAENRSGFEGPTLLVSILDLQSEAHISEKKNKKTNNFVLRHIPPIHVHERLKRRNAASSLSETKTEEPESCSNTTLRLACWLFDIRLVSQRGRMTSVAGCRKHVCRRCIFPGQGIYIFVTIYQRNILLLGVYNFFFNKMLMLAVFYVIFFVWFVLLQHCFQGAGGPK